MNVKINAAQLKDRETANRLVAEANEIVSKANQTEQEITQIVDSKIQ